MTYSAFLQDEIALRPNLSATLGSKLLRNDYTGWEVQPSARLLWRATPQQNLWTAVSRAVRTPTRVDRAGTIVVSSFPIFAPGPPGPPIGFIPLAAQPNRDLLSEVVVAWELGYRVQLRSELSLDLALFQNDYENLAQIDPATGLLTNRGEARARGAELAGTWVALPWLRFSGSWTVTHIDANDRTPPHVFQARASLDLGRNVEFDLGVFYSGVRHVPDATIFGTATVPRHTRVDARIGWRPVPKLELALVAQDLFDRQHLDLPFVNETQVQIQRSIYVQGVWSF